MSRISQHLRNGFNGVSLYTGKLISAGVGAVLYPMARLWRLSISFLFISVVAFIAIPILSVVAGSFLHSLFPSMGWVGATFGGMLAASALIGLTAGLLPAAFLISALFTLIKSPIDGARNGWNDGFSSMLSHAFESAALPGAEGVDFQRILEQLGEQATNAARQPMTEEQFNALEMSTADVRALKSEQLPPLSSEQLAMLEKADDVQIKAMVERYKNLQRLETDNCSILADRPERDDTILLVKQYQKDGQWLPVPAAAHIFDKSALKMAMVGNTGTRGNGIHPVTREKIMEPSEYTDVDGICYRTTRYVFHPYYVDASGPGISQEINQVTAYLNQYLMPKRQSSSEHEMPPGYVPSFPGLGGAVF